MKSNDSRAPVSRASIPPAVFAADKLKHSILLFGDSKRLRDNFLRDLELMGYSICSVVGMSHLQIREIPNIRFVAFHVDETVWEQLEVFTRAYGQHHRQHKKLLTCLVLRSGDAELDNLVEKYLNGLPVEVKGIDGPDFAAESMWIALDIANNALNEAMYIPEGFGGRLRIDTGALSGLDYQNFALCRAVRQKNKVVWWKLFNDILPLYAELCVPLKLTIQSDPSFFESDLDYLRLETVLRRLRSDLQKKLVLQFSAQGADAELFSSFNLKKFSQLNVETEYAVPRGQLPCFKTIGFCGFDRLLLDTEVFGGKNWSKVAEGLFCMLIASFVEVGMKTAVSGAIETSVLKKLSQIGCEEHLQVDDSTRFSLEALRHLANLNGKMGGRLV